MSDSYLANVRAVCTRTLCEGTATLPRCQESMMASFRRNDDIWRTQSSSGSPIRFDDITTNRKLIRPHAEGDSETCRLAASPGHAVSGKQRQRGGHGEPEMDRLRAPEGVTTSGDVDVDAEQRRTANIYVDAPAADVVGFQRGGSSTREDIGVKSTSSTQHIGSGITHIHIHQN